MLPYRFRRAVSVAIPLFTAALFWGVVKAFFGIGIDDNIAQTGITVKFIFGALNLVIFWWIWKHRVP